MTGMAWHLPRRTVRLRLTLLYVGLFLASAACLLVITYFLVAQQLPQVTLSTNGGGSSGSVSDSLFVTSGEASLSGPSATAPTACPQQAVTCMNYLAKQAVGLRSNALNMLLLESGIALGIMALASVGLGWLMAGRVLSPLRVITATARRISARNLHQRIGMNGPHDELKELGDTFDQLLGRLEASFRAQRQFVANASHELRTPLARQRTLLEVALRDKHATCDTLRTACVRALAAGEQHERLIAAMLTLARSERGLDRFEPFDLGEIAEDALAAHGTETRAKDIKVVAGLSPAPTAGDPSLAERLITNLIDNALRYNEQRGRLEVSTGMRDGRPFIVISNTGQHVPADQLGRLFQPFQRLAPARGVTGKDGLGLGLVIVTAIAAAHGAELRAHARPGGGLAVEILFPPRATPIRANLDRRAVLFSGPHPDHAVQRGHPDLAVADGATLRSFQQGLDDVVDFGIVDHDVKAHLR
jgi:signal transduction histidine kinase